MLIYKLEHMILEGKNEEKTDKVTESVIESCDMESSTLYRYEQPARPRS